MRNRSAFGLWQIVFGVVTIVFGVWTLIRPDAALGGFVSLMGILIIISGISDIIFYVKMTRYTLLRPVLIPIIGVVNILLGIILTFNIGSGVFAMGTLFPLWFFFHCIGRLCSMDYTKHLIPK